MVAVSSRVRIVRITEAEARAELNSLYDEHPALRHYVRECCGGCAEGDLAAEYGWDSPILGAWDRVERLRFLLGDD